MARDWFAQQVSGWLTLLKAAGLIRKIRSDANWSNIKGHIFKESRTDRSEAKELYRCMSFVSCIPVSIAGVQRVTGPWKPPHITLSFLKEDVR